ncbi:MAG: hypothetical protein H7Y04_13750, partial [Verrucomicrobia bacterium]|nr:hypothetical protein [Cytophagales bacterium]
EEELNINLLKLFLQKCHEKNWVAPPEFVVRLLNLAKDKKYKSLQKQLFMLTGKRGEWLAQFKPDWNFVQATDYAKVWDEGKGQERLEMFVDLRKADPAKARQLLQKTWQQEAYNTKTALVNSFKNKLSQEDEPFLQQIFEEIQIARTKKKDVYADLLKTVVDLLLSLPDSALSKEIEGKIKGYVTLKSEKKLLGLVNNKTWVLDLPEKEDGFFNTENMCKRLGFDGVSRKISTHTDIESWADELIKYINPQSWKQILQVNTEEVIKIFLDNPGFTKEQKKTTISLFSEALELAVCRFKDYEFAKLLNQTRFVPDLFSLLNQDDMMRLKEEIDINIRDFSQVFLQERFKTFSLDFTQFIMKYFHKQTTVNHFFYEHRITDFISQAITFIHPDFVKEVAYMPYESQKDWEKQQWQQNIAAPMQKMAAIRQEIEKL